MKKLALSALSASLCIFMSGCSIGNIGIDGLLSAPKLSQKQTLIHEALLKSVNKEISLKYPKTGDNRSAYVIANIDNEPTEEAIVFFQYADPDYDTGTVMVEILDQNSDGDWEAVYQFSGEGPDVDKIAIKELGENDKPSVIIGYSTLNLDEKQFQIYSYDRGALSSIYTDTYSIMEVLDIEGSGHNDILKISSDSRTGVSEAALLRLSGEEISAVDKIEMTAGTSSYLSSVIGMTADGSQALFADALKSSGYIQTEVVSYSYDKLQNPMVTFSDKLQQKTTRLSSYVSMDLDKDGVIEIPVTRDMPGYEEYNDTDQNKIFLTDWYVYKDSYSLKKKYSGYYRISDGYAFMFPEKWSETVTVKNDAKTGESVFYEYNKTSAQSGSEILRLGVIDGDELDEYKEKGYVEIASSGQLCYIAAISDTSGLSLDFETVKKCFYLV